MNNLLQSTVCVICDLFLNLIKYIEKIIIKSIKINRLLSGFVSCVDSLVASLTIAFCFQ